MRTEPSLFQLYKEAVQPSLDFSCWRVASRASCGEVNGVVGAKAAPVKAPACCEMTWAGVVTKGCAGDTILNSAATASRPVYAAGPLGDPNVPLTGQLAFESTKAWTQSTAAASPHPDGQPPNLIAPPE